MNADDEEVVLISYQRSRTAWSWRSFGAAVVLAALALAACGKSSSSRDRAASPTTGAPPASSSTSTTASAASPEVTTKTDAKLGLILADAQGMTVYTLTSNGKPVPCSAACASVWPPLELPAGVTTPTGGPGVTALGTAQGPGGTTLVTSGGLPLYRFSQDKEADDAYGEGLQSFGGVWHVVKAGAAPSPPSSGSGSGY